MCGIAGIINFKNHENMRETLSRMIGLMHHRGPDASGIFLGRQAGLVHARLSIIDLNGGDQPIHNEDRSVWIVFNGEIFNYPDLRKKLISKGHRFYTQTDTEVLVHLYEEEGVNLFDQLNGQFAFAIWDLNKEALLLGRDRLGIRPLFYHQYNGRFLFGSEIKAIFADDTVPRKIDTQTLSDIFTCWAPVNSQTPFEGISQIPPGCYAIYSKQDGLKIEPYWQLSFSSQGQGSNLADRSIKGWAEEIGAILYDATKIRLRADVPVGAYLSGGIDSTFTSALVKNNFNNRLCTFSVGFTDERFDESDFQKKAISALGTNHKLIQCSEEDIGRSFPDVIWHTETPILRTAPVPLYSLSGLVKDSDFKVVLTGEGADEIFAGYNIFREDKVRRFWAKDPDSNMRPMLLEKLYPYIFSQGKGKSKRFLKTFFKKDLSRVESQVYSHQLRWQNTSQIKVFFSSEINNRIDSLDQFIDRFTAMLPREFMQWEPLSRAQYIESKIFLSNYLLSSQGDRMAMAHSIEGRYPFLDHRVVEMAAQIPAKMRINGLNEKYILKKAAQDVVPEEIINRPKQPYRAPISRCFFGKKAPEYVYDLLSEGSINKTGYFDNKKVQRLLAKCHKQDGALLSEREKMAVVGILSTQLVDHQFIQHFSKTTIENKNMLIFKENEKA